MLRLLLPLLFLLSPGIFADEPSPVELERQEKYVKEYRDATPKDFSTELWSVVFTLFMIIALLIGGTWFMKRFVTGKMIKMNETSTIKILDQRNISAKSAIYIVEVYDRHIIIGESAGNITALAEFPIEDEPKTFSMEKS